MRAATWHNTWDKWVRDVVHDGGQGRLMQEEDGAHGGAHEGGMHAEARGGRAAKQQQGAVHVRRQGEWWMHVHGAPVARRAHAVELEEDEGMLQPQELEVEPRLQPTLVGLQCNDGNCAHTPQQCVVHGVQVRQHAHEGEQHDVRRQHVRGAQGGRGQQSGERAPAGEAPSSEHKEARPSSSLFPWFTGKRISKNVSVHGLGTERREGGREHGSAQGRGTQVVNTWGGARGAVREAMDAVVGRCRSLFFRDAG